jgi:hypothetical protein
LLLFQILHNESPTNVLLYIITTPRRSRTNKQTTTNKQCLVHQNHFIVNITFTAFISLNQFEEQQQQPEFGVQHYQQKKQKKPDAKRLSTNPKQQQQQKSLN